MINPFITFKYDDKAGTCTIDYLECSDSGRFITVCGLMINTESGYACLGYNTNSAFYIPVFDFVDALNKICCPTEELINKDSMLYIVENLKLNSDNFQIVDYLNSLQARKFASKSIIINITQQNTVQDLYGIDKMKSSIMLVDDDDFYKGVFDFMAGVNERLDSLGKEFFSNFFVEKTDSQVMSAVSSEYSKFSWDDTVEEMFVRNIRDRGVDAKFLREVVSLGIARNKRHDICTTITMKKRRLFGLLSSWAYMDTWEARKSSSAGGKKFDPMIVPESKIKSYNVLDLIKGIDREHDLFFSYRMASDLGDDKYFNTLINKLKLTTEVMGIGVSTFLNDIRQFAGDVSLKRDMGVSYAYMIEPNQKDFISFSVKSMNGAGKIIDKACKKILGKF
jgi:hypothetical protein